MWYPVVLLGAAFLLPVLAEDSPQSSGHLRAKRLTTFGKSPTGETDPKTVPRGKECRSDDDCAALEFTLCKVDTDDRTRCLCHDLQPPANGECATKRRELHQNCNYDHECVQGAECVVNVTVKANEKRCYCRWGFVEEENECNDGYRLSGLFYLVLFTSYALMTTHRN